MDQLEYEEVVEWYNDDKDVFDTWELNRIRDFYNNLVQLENPSDLEKELIGYLLFKELFIILELFPLLLTSSFPFLIPNIVKFIFLIKCIVVDSSVFKTKFFFSKLFKL